MLELKRESGQGLAEYGLILVLIAVVVVVILAVLGEQTSEMFSKIQSSIPVVS
jgi:pilus assembly protein Flp/PilA